jgi:ADP-heptose:LPS heptosyltransferase
MTKDMLGIEIYKQSDAIVRIHPENFDWSRGFYGSRRAAIERAGAVACESEGSPGTVFSRLDWPTPTLPDEFVLVHATSAWDHKSLPAEHLTVLLRGLLSRGHKPVVVSSAGQHESVIDGVIFIQGWPLASVVSIVHRAKYCICIDSSISHIAYWLRKPLHVFYRAADPGWLLASMPMAPSYSKGEIEDIEQLLSCLPAIQEPT